MKPMRKRSSARVRRQAVQRLRRAARGRVTRREPRPGHCKGERLRRALIRTVRPRVPHGPRQDAVEVAAPSRATEPSRLVFPVLFEDLGFVVMLRSE